MLPGMPSARPAVDVAIGTGGDFTMRSLVDTGASMNRMPAWIADEVGVDLANIEPMDAVGGRLIRARVAVARLELPELAWEAPVAFCDPWPWGFGILGVDGFLRWFRATIDVSENWFSLEPVDR